MSYKEWGKWLRRMREAAKAAQASGGSKVLKLTTRGAKGLIVLTFVFTATKEGILVAAEDATRDAAWPFIDIAEQACEEAGEAYEEYYRSGTLRRGLQQSWFWRLLNDPSGGDIPNRAGRR